MKKFSVVFFYLMILTPFLLPAQSYQGRLRTATDHFVFIYEEKDTAAVRELVTFAENVYGEVTAYFDYYPDRVFVIVNGRTDDSNGYYSPLPDKMEFFIASPSGPWMGALTTNWLHVLFVHEFTHYVHLTYGKGFYGALARVFGTLATSPLAFHVPGWMIEGITTTLETRLTEGGRGRNPFFEFLYKAPIMEDTLFSMWQAAYRGVYPPRGRIYIAGYLMIDYMMDTFGEDVFEKINREYAKFPLFGAWTAIRKVTGKPAKEIFTDMKSFYERKYEPFKALPNGEVLAPKEFGNYYLPLITDKGLVTYRSTQNRPPALIFFDPETGSEQKLLEVYLSDEYSFTAESSGKKVIFAAASDNYAHPSGTESISDLYLLETETGRTKRLTKNAHLRHPALSPDGSVLVAVRTAGSYHHLVTVNMSNGAVNALYEREQAFMYSPVFSPDGNRLAFTMNLRGMQDIYLLEFNEAGVNGNSQPEIRPLMGTDFPGEYNPRWADQKTIIFSSDRTGNLSLYRASFPQDTPHSQQEAVRGGVASIYALLVDPIAALGGIVYGKDIIYASYSSRGFTLKRKSLTDTPGLAGNMENGRQTEAIVPDGKDPPPVYVWKEIGPTRAYVDLPRPVLWLPIPFLTFAGNPYLPFGADLGIGLIGLAKSPLQRVSVQALAGVYPRIMQPFAQLDLSISLPPLTFSYNLIHDYKLKGEVVGGTYSQNTANSLKITAALLSTQGPRFYRSVNLWTGLSHTFSVESYVPFTVADSLGLASSAAAGSETPAVVLTADHDLTLSFGASVSLSAPSAARDLSAPGIAAGLRFDIPLALYPDDPGGMAVSGIAVGAIPLFTQRIFVRLGIRESYIPPSLISVYGHNTFPRGGGFGSGISTLSHPLALLGALDFGYTLAVLDLPLLFGFNIQHIGMNIHVETEAGFSLANGSVLGNYIYPGLELNVLFGHPTFRLPLSFGLAFRINRINPALFDPSKDISPYLVMSFNSFTAGFDSCEKAKDPVL